MGGWYKEWYNKDENNKLEGLHQKPNQMEETRWEGQNFSEVVAPEEEEEEELRSYGGRLNIIFRFTFADN
jgi:hypothetical protein